MNVCTVLDHCSIHEFFAKGKKSKRMVRNDPCWVVLVDRSMEIEILSVHYFVCATNHKTLIIQLYDKKILR